MTDANEPAGILSRGRFNLGYAFYKIGNDYLPDQVSGLFGSGPYKGFEERVEAVSKPLCVAFPWKNKYPTKTTYDKTNDRCKITDVKGSGPWNYEAQLAGAETGDYYTIDITAPNGSGTEWDDLTYSYSLERKEKKEEKKECPPGKYSSTGFEPCFDHTDCGTAGIKTEGDSTNNNVCNEVVSTGDDPCPTGQWSSTGNQPGCQERNQCTATGIKTEGNSTTDNVCNPVSNGNDPCPTGQWSTTGNQPGCQERNQCTATGIKTEGNSTTDNVCNPVVSSDDVPCPTGQWSSTGNQPGCQERNQCTATGIKTEGDSKKDNVCNPVTTGNDSCPQGQWSQLRTFADCKDWTQCGDDQEIDTSVTPDELTDQKCKAKASTHTRPTLFEGDGDYEKAKQGYQVDLTNIVFNDLDKTGTSAIDCARKYPDYDLVGHRWRSDKNSSMHNTCFGLKTLNNAQRHAYNLWKGNASDLDQQVVRKKQQMRNGYPVKKEVNYNKRTNVFGYEESKYGWDFPNHANAHTEGTGNGQFGKDVGDCAQKNPKFIIAGHRREDNSCFGWESLTVEQGNSYLGWSGNPNDKKHQTIIREGSTKQPPPAFTGNTMYQSSKKGWGHGSWAGAGPENLTVKAKSAIECAKKKPDYEVVGHRWRHVTDPGFDKWNNTCFGWKELSDTQRSSYESWAGNNNHRTEQVVKKIINDKQNYKMNVNINGTLITKNGNNRKTINIKDLYGYALGSILFLTVSRLQGYQQIKEVKEDSSGNIKIVLPSGKEFYLAISETDVYSGYSTSKTSNVKATDSQIIKSENVTVTPMNNLEIKIKSFWGNVKYRPRANRWIKLKDLKVSGSTDGVARLTTFNLGTKITEVYVDFYDNIKFKAGNVEYFLYQDQFTDFYKGHKQSQNNLKSTNKWYVRPLGATK